MRELCYAECWGCTAASPAQLRLRMFALDILQKARKQAAEVREARARGGNEWARRAGSLAKPRNRSYDVEVLDAIVVVVVQAMKTYAPVVILERARRM